MSGLSKTLQKHLRDSAEKGSPSAVLFAQIAFVPTTIFLWKTRLCAEHDSTGIIVALSYQSISAVLISNLWRLSQCESIHGKCCSMLNPIANGISLILGIVLKEFYEKSLSFLGFALSITVLFLILLVIIRPPTDLGLTSFLIGVIGSVAYNLFRHKFQTWIVFAICFLLFGFKGWIDKKWLEVEVDHKPREDRSSKSEIIEAVVVAGFHLFWVWNLFRINCLKIEVSAKSISCTLSSIMGMLAGVLIFILWFGLAVVLRVRSLFQIPRGDEEGQPRRDEEGLEMNLSCNAVEAVPTDFYLEATEAEDVPLRGDEEEFDIEALLDFLSLEATEAEHVPLFSREMKRDQR
ncbi:hypothetical protein SLEP1_g23880 [Rubroshorea leprosula]|uniref:Uncharacterized protein n=1 Tax=Rubroshorea leprosula TaxID=152421 RepID=A0AAV5JE01_9ROSI|nr:hypothetical protein SLEP1_g23880 [Rubroshorea leprosula]